MGAADTAVARPAGPLRPTRVGAPSVLAARAIPAKVRARLGALAAAGVVGAGLAIVVGVPLRGSVLVPSGVEAFPDWLGGPVAGRGNLITPSDYGALFILMCLCYGGTLACAASMRSRAVIAAVAVGHVLFALAPPLLSGDVFGYIGYARLGGLHGLDPYLYAAEAVPSDPAFPFVRWRYLPSPYGPLWTLLTYPLSGLDVAQALWTLKAAAGAAGLACVALVGACAQRLGRPAAPAVALVGLNPLWLTWAVGGAHNDLLAMAAVLGGVLLSLGGREAAGAGALAAAAAVKASAGLALPFLVLGARKPRRAALGALLGAAVVGLLALAVFGEGLLGYLSILGRQAHFVSRHSVPNEIGKLLGLGGTTPAGLRVAVTPEVRLVAGTALAATIAVLLVSVRRGGDWITAAAWATVALLVSTAFLVPWYVVWLLPLAALARSRGVVAATLLVTAFLVVTRTPLLMA